MTFPVEIVLKGRDYAVTESIVVPSGDAPAWNDALVHQMLVEILRAIGRVENPEVAADRPVFLHGFSWIVEPMDGRVVLAIEMPMGAAVAGPFDVEQADLDAVVGRVIRADRQRLAPDTIH
ncbi:MAG: hypothetical protein ABS36_01210 [Acidobacteria bacterium SCN 69-37]|nr:MAG: hypothetical protein ABS36_01210 [Acidobacteria bacterium SCN 69-37]